MKKEILSDYQYSFNVSSVTWQDLHTEIKCWVCHLEWYAERKWRLSLHIHKDKMATNAHVRATRRRRGTSNTTLYRNGSTLFRQIDL